MYRIIMYISLYIYIYTYAYNTHIILLRVGARREMCRATGQALRAVRYGGRNKLCNSWTVFMYEEITNQTNNYDPL